MNTFKQLPTSPSPSKEMDLFNEKYHDARWEDLGIDLKHWGPTLFELEIRSPQELIDIYLNPRKEDIKRLYLFCKYFGNVRFLKIMLDNPRENEAQLFIRYSVDIVRRLINIYTAYDYSTSDIIETSFVIQDFGLDRYSRKYPDPNNSDIIVGPWNGKTLGTKEYPEPGYEFLGYQSLSTHELRFATYTSIEAKMYKYKLAASRLNAQLAILDLRTTVDSALIRHSEQIYEFTDWYLTLSKQYFQYYDWSYSKAAIYEQLLISQFIEMELLNSYNPLIVRLVDETINKKSFDVTYENVVYSTHNHPLSFDRIFDIFQEIHKPILLERRLLRALNRFFNVRTLIYSYHFAYFFALHSFSIFIYYFYKVIVRKPLKLPSSFPDFDSFTKSLLPFSTFHKYSNSSLALLFSTFLLD
jgi:hypothetical protein